MYTYHTCPIPTLYLLLFCDERVSVYTHLITMAMMTMSTFLYVQPFFAVLLQHSYESRYTAGPRIWTMGNPASSFMPIETMLKPNTCLSLKRYT